MEPAANKLSAAQAADWVQAHPFGAADANGVDRTLVERCLSISPLERIRRNWLASLNAARARIDPRTVDAKINGCR
jgi:hypothetical protein